MNTNFLTTAAHRADRRPHLYYLQIMRSAILLLILALSWLPPSLLGIAPVQPALNWVLAATTGLWGLSLWQLRSHHIGQPWLLMHLLLEVLYLYAWLKFSGGATNAFVSLLLLPVALAAISLPRGPLMMIALATVLAYTQLLWDMPGHAGGDHLHHGMTDQMADQMNSHFVGMWVTFLISVAVLSLLVSRLAALLHQRDHHLAKLREEQLRQENLLALGTASTQMVHQFATPLATLQLVQEELKQTYPDEPLIDEMAAPLHRCQQDLSQIRTIVQRLQQNEQPLIKVSELLVQVAEQIHISYPALELKCAPLIGEGQIQLDPALLPALLNLVHNAARASTQNNIQQVQIQAHCERQTVVIEIRDYGPGIDSDHLPNLGQMPVNSEEGMGVSLLLSHATLERLGGELSLRNHIEQGAIAQVRLPLWGSEEPKDE